MIGLVLFGRASPFFLNLIMGVMLVLMSIVILKHIFRRKRPVYPDDPFAIVKEHDSYSFPSGHSMIAGMVAGMFSIVASFHWIVQIIIIIWAVGVIISRVVIGRHHVLDVVVGFILGFSLSGVIYGIWITEEQLDNFLPKLMDFLFVMSNGNIKTKLFNRTQEA